MGLSIGVYHQLHSYAAVAAVAVLGVLPALLAPAVVARIERSEKRGGLTVLYTIEGLCALGLAAALWQFSLPAIFVLVTLDGSVEYAARALVRSEAARAGEASGPSDDRALDGRPLAKAGARRANAALNVSLSLSGVLGPALAGGAVKAFGAPSALLLDAGCFAASGLLLIDLRPHVEEAARSVRERLAAARAHLRAAPRLRALIVTEGVGIVFFVLAIPVEVGYAESTLRAGELGYGALLAAWGAGQVLGSLAFLRAGRWLWAMLVGGTLAVGFAYIGYAVAPTLLVACIAAVPGGIGNGVQWASFLGVVQQLTPGRLLGRIMGVAESTAAVAPVIGYSLGGLIGEAAGPRATMLVAGVVASAIALAFIRIGGLRRVVGTAAEPPAPTAEGPAQPESGVGTVVS